jgi:hypothetical protein
MLCVCGPLRLLTQRRWCIILDYLASGLSPASNVLKSKKSNYVSEKEVGGGEASTLLGLLERAVTNLRKT